MRYSMSLTLVLLSTGLIVLVLVPLVVLAYIALSVGPVLLLSFLYGLRDL